MTTEPAGRVSTLRAALALGIAVLAGTLTGCTASGGSSQPDSPAAASSPSAHPRNIRPPARTAAARYLAAHPVHATPGMTTVVILTVDAAGFQDAAAQQAGCQNPAGCGAWTATAETATRQIIDLSCGSIARRENCPLERTPQYRKALAQCPIGAACSGPYAIPMPGDYLRARTGGHISTGTDLQIITAGAVQSILNYVPNIRSPWVTSRATSPQSAASRSTGPPVAAHR